MSDSIKALAITALLVIASSPAAAENRLDAIFGADTGYLPAEQLNLLPAPTTAQSPGSLGPLNLNFRFGLQDAYGNINTLAPLPESITDPYQQNLFGGESGEPGNAPVAGASIITTLIKLGPVRPFTRAGLLHYDFEAVNGQPVRGDSLQFGMGADIDLPRGWNARLEWERYSNVGRLDSDMFSARFEYRF